MMKAVMKWGGDGEKRTEWKVWECIWCRKDGWWIGMILSVWNNGAIVQVMGNIQGGMGKRGKKKRKESNPWESDGGSETKSSAEEQFDVIDKAALMEEHRKELGNKYIDMMVDMEVEDIKAKLEELREMTEGTEDQKTLAVLSLIWMVERRKEEQWEEQREREEAEQREVHRKREM